MWSLFKGKKIESLITVTYIFSWFSDCEMMNSYFANGLLFFISLEHWLLIILSKVDKIIFQEGRKCFFFSFTGDGLFSWYPVRFCHLSRREEMRTPYYGDTRDGGLSLLLSHSCFNLFLAGKTFLFTFFLSSFDPLNACSFWFQSCPREGRQERAEEK